MSNKANDGPGDGVGSNADVNVPFEELAELVQVFSQLGKPYSIRVGRGNFSITGEVGVADGRVVHAEYASRTGVPAFLEIMSWGDGVIIDKFVRPQPVSIHLSLAELLLEAYWHTVDVPEPGDLEQDDGHSFSREKTAKRQTPIPENLKTQPNKKKEKPMSQQSSGAQGLKDMLNELKRLDGFIAAAIADAESGMMLASETTSSDFNIEVAAAVNTDVVKSKLKAMKALKISGGIEDILITLQEQYHLIRPLADNPQIFLYLALDRSRSNLALARMGLTNAEKDFKL